MPETERYVMLVDLDSCSGCHACAVACKAEHRVPDGQFRTRVQSVEFGQFPKTQRQFVPTLCQHCEAAPCIDACPTGAIQANEFGIVSIREDTCVGSGPCVDACPYGAISLNLDEYVAQKCDFCSDRLAGAVAPEAASGTASQAIAGMVSGPLPGAAESETVPGSPSGTPSQAITGTVSPACVATCPTDAMHFGLTSDPGISALLNSGEYSGPTARWELQRTVPQVYYKGLKSTTRLQLARINSTNS